MKRIAALTIALGGLVLSATACGDDSGSSGSATDNGGSAKSPTVSAPASIDPWSVSPGVLGLSVGDTGVFACPGDGEIGAVWGNKTYTDDSTICGAAVFEGRISTKDGGIVSFKMVAGLDAYEGGSANGVVSQEYGPWGASFVLTD